MTINLKSFLREKKCFKNHLLYKDKFNRTALYKTSPILFRISYIFIHIDTFKRYNVDDLFACNFIYQ